VPGRAAATALGKLTWGLAIAFIATSLTLTIIAAQESSGASVLDRVTDAPADETAPGPAVPEGDDLLPPSADDSAPLTPTAD
ncbi:preprotein translocase subunit SecG, partial [Roseovarius sp. SYSU LYC5161]|uniref:preprotein translocase subunit SecG n=1 Tax=Roseovarius halophilus (ex Wu et al. 2025) TaxID=3376060 RepID=UPI00399B88CE